MKVSQLFFVLALLISPLWNDAPGAEKAPDELQRAANVVGEYLLTLYSNDAAGNERTRIPGTEGASPVGQAVLSGEELARVRQEVSGLSLGLVEPFRLHGRIVTPDSKGECPVGTSVSFTTQSRGVIIVIPVVKMASGWKVDVRFWVALGKESKEDDPEAVTRKFLHCLISREENDLKELVVQGSDLRSIISGKAPFEDQYYALAMEMPVVESMEGEGMLLADGTAVAVQQSTPQSKWLTGLYGYHKLVFALRLEKGKWRVVPRDYLSVISRSETRPATREELAPLHVILPPVAATQKAVPRAAPPKPVMVPVSSNPTPEPGVSAGVRIGSSFEEVRKIMGTPKGLVAMGAEAIWTYPALTVEFRDGKVESLNGVSGQSARQTQNSTPGQQSRPISPTSNEAALDPETMVDELQQAANAVGQYFLTLGTGDMAGNVKISYPALESATLCKRLFYPRAIEDETIAQVREEVAKDMGLTQETPFRYRGSVAKPDGKGRYPVGTTVVLGTEHVGTRQAFSPLLYGDHDCTLIPVTKTDGGWKVDVRFWLARLGSQSREQGTNLVSQERVIREFLRCSFRRKIGALKDLAPTGSDYLFLTNSLIAPAEAELFEKLEDSPLCLAEAQVGEAMLLADNTVVTAQAGTEQSQWLVGLWGRHQKLLFELRREQSGWRLVPRDYVGVIRNCETECDALGELAELKIVLPPVQTKGRVQ